MVLVTPGVALILFGTILVVSIGLAWWMGTFRSYDSSTFHTFIAILGGLGVFITFMFYYSVVELQQLQYATATSQEFARINVSIQNTMLNDVKDAVLIIPNFVASIQPLTPYCVTKPDPKTEEAITKENVLSSRIFGIWQDVMIANANVRVNCTPYINLFLQQANSKQLYQVWQRSYLNYECRTIEFGDLLFKYGLPIREQTPESYMDAAQELIRDPTYLAL